MLAINEVLQQGRYRITNRFERATASGAGYEAYDNVLETNVLLKEISVNQKKVGNAAPVEAVESGIESEAKILTAVKHESLARVRDCFSEIDRQYLVLEAVDGADLGELLEKNKSAFAVADVVNWADQLLDALHYLHTRTPPIFHLDIKPQNIKLTADGKIKLLAFNIAETPNAAANAHATNQSFDPAILHYSPLEQIWSGLDRASQNVIANSYDEKSEKILNQPPDARTDVYRLGATLYQLLTARLPVDALERSIDILEGKSDPLRNPHRINPKIPPEISQVVSKALEIKRENRFFSAIVMRQVLRTAVVRVREREAEQAKREYEEAKRKIQSAETQRLERERQAVEQKRSELEAKRKRENESVKNRLRESEAKRLDAEQRAAAAEKRLFEMNVEKSAENESAKRDRRELLESEERKSPAAAVRTERNLMSAPLASKVQSEPGERLVKSENSPEVFKDLFVQTPKDNKIWRRMSVAVLVSVIFGAAAFGIWNFKASETSVQNQTPSDQPVQAAIETEPALIVETTPLPIMETTPEISQMPAPSDSPSLNESSGLTESTNAVRMPISRYSTRNKPALPSTSAPRVEKRMPPPIAKPTPAQKKPVTVDDLINDN